MVRLYEGDRCWREAALKQSPNYVRKRHQDVKQWALSLAKRAQKIEKDSKGLPDRVCIAQQKGKLALVLGAGVSISCGFPSWNVLVDTAVKRVLSDKDIHYDEIDKLLTAISFGDDLLSLSQALTTLVEESEVKSVLASILYAKDHVRSDLLSSIGEIIASSFEINLRLRRPTVVLTFNYDRLIEEELERLGINVRVWPRNTHIDGLPLDSVNVVHPHGILDKEPPFSTSIVFTESSYGQAYLREPSADPLSELLELGVLPLFVGFSFRDNYVRRVLHQHSIKSDGPVAVGVLANEAVINSRKLKAIEASSSFSQGYDASEIIGVRRAGVDPVAERSRTVIHLPSHLVRWILYSIGVEWYEVSKHRDVPSALSNVFRHPGNRSTRPTRASR